MANSVLFSRYSVPSAASHSQDMDMENEGKKKIIFFKLKTMFELGLVQLSGQGLDGTYFIWSRFAHP